VKKGVFIVTLSVMPVNISNDFAVKYYVVVIFFQCRCGRGKQLAVRQPPSEGDEC
jgi:hypothetical protein